MLNLSVLNDKPEESGPSEKLQDKNNDDIRL